jgi:CheY-like chemotaxis protein
MHGKASGFGKRAQPLGRLLVSLGLLGIPAAAALAEPLDGLQRAVIESIDSSLALPGGETPATLLAAAIRAADVDALEAAEQYLGRLAMRADEAGDEGPELFADLADTTDNVDLGRLAGVMDRHEPAAARLVRAIVETGRMRRRDPARLAETAAELARDERAVRQRAAEQLLAAGVDALPVLVPLLPEQAGEAKPAARQRWLARELIARLGDDARQPLLDWLTTGDPADWAAVIEALDASGASDIEDFLLPPAFVADTPPAAQAAARRVLERRAVARGAAEPPIASSAAAIGRLFARLDHLLTPDGLPAVDCLVSEPITDPAKAAAAFGGTLDGGVSRLLWNPEQRRFERMTLSPRAARGREAAFLARSLQALDAREEAVVDLVLLARLETALLASGTSAAELERMPGDIWTEPLTGPDGIQADLAAGLIDQAIVRGMWLAAAATARAVVPDSGPVTAAAGSEGTMSPDLRDALVRALAVPDATLQFAAARTLALAAGEPPYRGSSRVLEVLFHAATSTGSDRAVIAHPNLAVAQELATGVSRFGYEPVIVSNGRQAVFAAREHADTLLVLLASRINTPTALETTQFLQQQPLGDMPVILVVVDPLDDCGRGRYLTRLLLSFRGLERVVITDRLDSLFQPVFNAKAEETGPRLPDVIAQAAGPRGVDPGSRAVAAAARRRRAQEALGLLAGLARRGWDVSPALDTAQRALLRPDFYGPAVSLLAGMGSGVAQSVLEQEAVLAELPEEARQAARTAFGESVERFGLLMTSGQLLDAYARYNSAADDTSRGAAGEILDLVESAGRNPQLPTDASSLESRR